MNYNSGSPKKKKKCSQFNKLQKLPANETFTLKYLLPSCNTSKCQPSKSFATESLVFENRLLNGAYSLWVLKFHW